MDSDRDTINAMMQEYIKHFKRIDRGANATESLKANLYYGYKVVGASKDSIYVETTLNKTKEPMRKDDNI